MKISKIFLYDEPAVPEIRLDSLASFLEETFRVKVTVRGSILDGAHDGAAREIAASRIRNHLVPFERHDPSEEEVGYEARRLGTRAADGIVMYDGFEFQNAVANIIPQCEQVAEIFHLVFTTKLTCTFDDADYRYHGRALIGSNPAIVSTTGIIEAPAKPRQYYLDIMANYAQGLNVESIKEKYRGDYLEYHDSRLGRVVEGYAMQAVFYYITGSPFCDLLDCRLNNAHWQRDLLYSQTEHGRLCKSHSEILSRWLALNNLNC